MPNDELQHAAALLLLLLPPLPWQQRAIMTSEHLCSCENYSDARP